MYVSLMAYVPDYLILRAVEDLVKSYGQFNHSQVGSHVSSGHGNLFNKEFPDLNCQKLHLLFGHVLKIFRKIVFC